MFFDTLLLMLKILYLFLNVYEYLDYAKYDFSKYMIKTPYWLNIQSQPKKTIKEIYETGLDFYEYNGLDYSVI